MVPTKKESKVLFDKIVKELGLRRNSADFKFLQKAFDVSYQLHKNQFRKDGVTPYIIHPLNVALVLAQSKSGLNTVVAGLLHDVIEDTEYSGEDLKRDFGDEVYALVISVTQISHENIRKEAEGDRKLKKDRESVIQIFKNLAKDYRVAVIKSADILHNARELHNLPPYRQVQTINKIKKYYLVLMEYLSIRFLWDEMLEIVFKFENEKEWKRKADRQKLQWARMKKGTFTELEVSLSKKFKVEVMVKPMKRKVKEDGEYLIVADVVYNGPPDMAYEISDYLKSKYLSRGLDKDIDNINDFKPNGWTAYATTLIYPNIGEVRFIIMPQSAEFVNNYGVNALRGEANFSWKFQTIRDFINGNKNLNIDLLAGEHLVRWVEVFCAIKGKVYKVPENGSILDFIASANPRKLSRFSSAIVNGIEIDHTYNLARNDLIEQIDFKQSKQLNFSWYFYAKTQKARAALIKSLGGKRRFGIMMKGYLYLKDAFELIGLGDILQMDESEKKFILQGTKINDFYNLFFLAGENKSNIEMLFKDKTINISIPTVGGMATKILRKASNNSIIFVNSLSSTKGIANVDVKFRNFNELVLFVKETKSYGKQ